jgi:phosphoribosylaminoimidazole-succinocarboxamide synthase
MISDQIIQEQIKHTLTETHLDFLGTKYQGKVRDNYTTKDGIRVLITTDKLSAFDRNIAEIPFKGEVLNRISTSWFKKTEHIVGNHMIDTPDPNVVIGKECQPLKIEMIIRGYITGSTGTSIWHSYAQGERTIYGLQFPDGLKKNDKLPEPIVTPTTKAPKGEHDERITKQEILEQSLVTPEEYAFLEQKTQELYAFGQAECAKNGLILMDTKYEFGKTSEGELVLIDEIHTPDSSRFAIAATFHERVSAGLEPENLNKEFLRLWLADNGYTGEGPVPTIPVEVIVETAKKYISAYEYITGETFSAEAGDVNSRIELNLKKYFNLT